MRLSYQTRCTLKRLGKTMLLVLAVGAIFFGLWLLWLNRYVVYTRDGGAILDFSKSVQELSGQVAVRPPEREPVSIYFSDGKDVNTGTELTKLKGYYVLGSELEVDIDAVIEKVQNLPKGTAVMVDVKSAYGNFFYSSSVSDWRNGDLDTEKMDRLIKVLNQGSLYTIARLPAFRDYKYAYYNDSQGLPLYGVGVYSDNSGYYWLNPAHDGVQLYLTQIALELRDLGFDEVLFSDFYIPSSGSINFNQDRKQTAENAAKILAETCADDSFTVSFTQEADFNLPDGRTRLYLEDVSAEQVASTVESTGLEMPDVKVVFRTELHDTRFDDYGVLRPLATLH